MRIRSKRRSRVQATTQRINFLKQYRNMMKKHHVGLADSLRQTVLEQHAAGNFPEILGPGIPWNGLKIGDPRLVPEPLYTMPWTGRGSIPYVPVPLVPRPVLDQDATISDTGLTYVQGAKDVTAVDATKLFPESDKKGMPVKRDSPFGIIDSMRLTFGEGPDPSPNTPTPISSVEVTLPEAGTWQVIPGFEKHLEEAFAESIIRNIADGSYSRAYPTAAGDFYFYYGKRSGAVPFTKSKLKKLNHRQAKKGRANHRLYYWMNGTRSLGGRIKDHVVERLFKFPGLFSSHNKARFDPRELTISHTYQEAQTNEDRMMRAYVKEMLDSVSQEPETVTIDTLNEKYAFSDKLAWAVQPSSIKPDDSKPVEMRMSTSQARARLGDDELYSLYLKKLDGEVKTHLANPLFAAIETVADEAHGKSVVYQEIILRAIRYISLSIPPRNIVTKEDFLIAAKDHHKGEPMPDWEAGSHIFPEYHIAHDVSMDLLNE